MDGAVDRDSLYGEWGLPRRWFLRGVGGALLGVGTGVLLMGCRRAPGNTYNNEQPPVVPNDGNRNLPDENGPGGGEGPAPGEGGEGGGGE